MKSISKLGLLLCFAGTLSFGAMWTGKLLDASCYDSNGKQVHAGIARTCAATAASKAFVMENRAGKVYKLDSNGNAKAEAALEKGALKPSKHGDVRARVYGHRHGDTIEVTSIGRHKKAVY